MKTLKQIGRTWLASSSICALSFAAVLPAAAQQEKPRDVVPKVVVPKEERYTLRYKPQLGTTLYDAETIVTHTLENGDKFPIISRAQLVWKNIAVDLQKSIWTFDRYYSRLSTIDRDTTIKEIGSINKVSRLTFSMDGQEIHHEVIDTAILSEDAQFLSYFFRAPRMILPLPLALVTYGASWVDERLDTVNVPGGKFRYSTHYLYEFDGVRDTLGGVAAIITCVETGFFTGIQKRIGEQQLLFNGPITGRDTMYLNLLTGRIVRRDSYLNIPVHVEPEHGPSSSDILDVHSSYVLNRSNIRSTGVQHDD
jgi:hypothetical protein